MTQKLTGGCHCQAIRYEVESVFDAGYCHCSICRKLSGAPVLAWANIKPEDFRLIQGNPREYASSSQAVRYFCSVCGSQVYGLMKESGYYWINVGTLDSPELVQPKVHICTSDRVAWFELNDSLPRYENNTLPHPDKRR